MGQTENKHAYEHIVMVLRVLSAQRKVSFSIKRGRKDTRAAGTAPLGRRHLSRDFHEKPAFYLSRQREEGVQRP